jgi:hypothetical protein
MFSFAILWRGVRAGESKDYPFGRKEGMKLAIIKLWTIITLHVLDGQTELIKDMSIEIMKSRVAIIFKK